MKKYIAIAAAMLCVVVGTVAWLQAAPAIGTVAANPAYIVVNTATPVLFTAQILDSSVIPTGVSLLRADASGKALATVGTLRDDGSNGDVVAGDRTFTMRLVLNHAALGPLDYRVSAAFRGVLQRVQSSPVRITVDPFPLPPDPGPVGTQTVVGIDTDRDGVRDDVQRFIAYSAPDSLPTRHALTQLARANHQFVAAVNADSATLIASVVARRQAIDCLGSITATPEQALTLQKRLRAQLLNTHDRSIAYLNADARLSGISIPRTRSTAPCL